MSSMPDDATRPTNEKEDVVADVHIPGPYPTGRGDPTGEPLTAGPEPTKASRDTASLGDLTEEVSAGTVREETGGLGSPVYDEKNTT
jgi:hypothetical protein